MTLCTGAAAKMNCLLRLFVFLVRIFVLWICFFLNSILIRILICQFLCLGPFIPRLPRRSTFSSTCHRRCFTMREFFFLMGSMTHCRGHFRIGPASFMILSQILPLFFRKSLLYFFNYLCEGNLCMAFFLKVLDKVVVPAEIKNISEDWFQIFFISWKLIAESVIEVISHFFTIYLC